eukprot:gene4348-3109_t
MNMHTFKDAVASRRQTVADQFLEDDDEEEVVRVDAKSNVEGEEDIDYAGGGKFNDGGDMITPFNMKDERESGFIDSDMNFVFKKEQQEVDAWVAGLNESTTEKVINDAAVAERKRLARLAEQERNQSDLDKMNSLELKVGLVALMLPGETVQRTLRRLSGKDVNANKGDSFKRRRAPTQDTDDAEHDDALSGHKRPISAAEQQRQTARHNRQAIERVTELADRLIGRGMNDIYTTSYEALQANTTRWEYQGADGSLYGPFTTKQILDWRQQGFLTGETAVMIRPVKHRVVLPLPASSSGATGVDSDDGSDRQRKRSRPNDVSASSSTAANAAAAANPTDDSSGTNDWQHSDSVDFRSIYRLDQEIGAHEESAPTREAHSTRPSGGSGGDQRRMAASANPSSHL